MIFIDGSNCNGLSRHSPLNFKSCHRHIAFNPAIGVTKIPSTSTEMIQSSVPWIARLVLAGLLEQSLHLALSRKKRVWLRNEKCEVLVL